MEEQREDNAPVVRLMLTVSFQQPLDLTIVELAAVATLFLDDYPIYRQIDRGGPMVATPSVPALTVQFGPMMNQSRLQFASEDLSSNVLFQNDRLSFGWDRQNPLEAAPGYPGFTAVFAMFERHLATLRKWAAARSTPIEPAVGEVHYTDAFSLAEPAPKPSDQFRLFNPELHHPVSTYNFTWIEAIEEGRPGFIQGIISAPGMTPTGVPIATLQTIARMDVASGWDAVGGEFEQAHRAIHRVYNQVVNPVVSAKS